MNQNVKGFLLGAFGYTLALIFVGLLARACWFFLELGWHLADYVSK